MALEARLGIQQVLHNPDRGGLGGGARPDREDDPLPPPPGDAIPGYPEEYVAPDEGYHDPNAVYDPNAPQEYYAHDPAYGQEQAGYDPNAPQYDEGYYGGEQQGQYDPQAYQEAYGEAPQDVQGHGYEAPASRQDAAPSSHRFVVGAGYGPEDMGQETPHVQATSGGRPVNPSDPDSPITQSPTIGSDPSAQQLSVGPRKVESAEPMPPPPALDEGVPMVGLQDYKVPTVADLARGGIGVPPLSLPPMPDSETIAEGPSEVRPNYATQSYGDMGGPAIDEDGNPRFIPQIPVISEEAGVPGRRVCGVSWLIFAALFGFVASLSGEFSPATVFLAPMVIGAFLLLYGASWGGGLGIFLSVIYFAAFSGIGYTIAYTPDKVDNLLGVSLFPPQVGFAFMGIAWTFVISAILMLVKAPGMGRAVLGAFVLLMPLIGGTVWINATTDQFTPKLASPTETAEAAQQGSTLEGFFFTKPAGWVSYEWNRVMELSSLATQLKKRPNYYYFNPTQAKMVSFYLDDIPPRTIATLLGQYKPSLMEETLIRGLPAVGRPSAYKVGGADFTERSYEGQLGPARLHLTIAKAEIGEKVLLVVLTQNVKNALTEVKDAEDPLNAFMSELRIGSN